MARWVVSDGDREFVVEASDGQVSLDITGDGPLVVAPERAEDVRTVIGTAIGAARAGT